MKICKICKIAKSLEEFYFQRGQYPRSQPYCKDCDNLLRKSRYNKRVINNPRLRYKLNTLQRGRRMTLRLRVLIHYGGNPPRCACCGESTLEFLCIDHLNGKGNQHRREIGTQGRNICNWLIRNNFPLGFRILCYNCNMAYGLFKKCPHKNNSPVVEYIDKAFEI